MSFKGIFFDFFGTLAIPGNLDLKWSEWYHNVYPLYKKNGFDISPDDFNTICKSFWSNKYNDEGLGLTLFEKRLTSQLEMYNIHVTHQNIKNLAFDISEAWFDEHRLDSEAIELFEFFSGKMKFALITNFDHPPLIKTMLKRYKIIDYFDSIIISGDVGVKKPMPEIFFPALEETGLTSEEVVYVGDSIMDFRAALHAGILPIIIRREGQHDPRKPGSVEEIYEKTDTMLQEFSQTGQIEVVTSLSGVKKVIKEKS